ncbi:MAG: hypothetical protein AAGC46_01485 [Solirubrobacteraceae bacterium]|nr:hypothetical protein [Patulibacter sp.]
MPRHLTLTFTETDDRAAFVQSMGVVGRGDLRVSDEGHGPLGFCVHQRGTESGAQSASRLVRWVDEVREHAELSEDAFQTWVGANPENTFQAFPGYTGRATAGSR